MLTHKQVWDGIDRLAARYHLSASGLAKRAGLDPTTFNKSKRITKQGKPRWPSTESVAKVLEATGADMLEYVGLMDSSAGRAAGAALRLKSLALGQIEKPGVLDSSGFPIGDAWEEVDFPGLDDANVFAIEIDSDSAYPSCRSGDLIVVSPGSSIRRSDRVMARLRDGTFVLGVLLRKTAQKVVIQRWTTGSDEQSFDADKVAWLARIVWISQ